MAIFRPGKVSYTDLGVDLSNYANVVGSVQRFLHTGSQFVLAEYDSSAETTELNYWDSDGSEAVSRLMENTRILDMVFDSNDDRYYAVRWMEGPGYSGTSGMSWSGTTVFRDDFASGAVHDDGKPSSALWYDAGPRWGVYTQHEQDSLSETASSDTTPWELFVRNTSSERLECTSSVGRGTVAPTIAVEGDFQAWCTMYLTTFSGSGSTFALRLIDRDTVFGTVEYNNLVAQAGFRGTYDASDTGTYPGAWESASAYLSNDSTGGAWAITNLRLREREYADVDYGLSYGSYVTFVISFYDYDAGDDTNYFKIATFAGAPLGYGVITNTKKTFDFVDGPIGFTLVGDPSGDLGSLTGSSIRLNIRIDNTVAAGSPSMATVSGTSGFKLGVGIAGTNVYTRRDYDGDVLTTSWENMQVYNLYPTAAHPIGLELYCDAVGASVSPDVSIDNFEVDSPSGVVTWPSIPTLRVESYDSTGAINYVSGVTDAYGVAIAALDVINLSSSGTGGYGSFLSNGFAAIASDQLDVTATGSLYLAVSRYKGAPTVAMNYLKSSLPLSSNELGYSASTLASGTLELGSLYYKNTLYYTGHTAAELSYVTSNPADMGRGVFVRALDGSTLSGTTPRKTAWLLRSDYFAWNLGDTNALYGVTLTGTEAGSVKLYNISPTSAAFCNVASSKRLLSAGSSTSSVVLAQVMNVYGEPLSGKTVSFTITAGDGSITPASALTNASGEALATYTVGTAVTTSTITATVSI